MGNQASIPPASRTTSVLPPHIPSQVPLPTPSRRERRYSEQESRGRGSIGTGSVPISGGRKLSGENGTPGTYETPPCINVKVGEMSSHHFDKTVFSLDKLTWMEEEEPSALQTKTWILLHSLQ